MKRKIDEIIIAQNSMIGNGLQEHYYTINSTPFLSTELSYRLSRRMTRLDKF
jgi:hypothetical protein